MPKLGISEHEIVKISKKRGTAIDKLDIHWGQFHLSIKIDFQTINDSLQNAFLEAVNDKMVQTFVHSENGLGLHFRL